MNSAIDVLHILYGGMGGQIAVVEELGRASEDRGIRTGVCLIAREPELIPRPEERFAVTHVFTVGRKGILDWSAGRSVARVLETSRPRVVVWHSQLAPGRLLLARWRGLVGSVLMVEHQPLHLWSHPQRVRSLLGLAVAKGVVFLSEDYRHNYPFRNFPFPSLRRSRVISNGVDTERYRPSSRTLTSNSVERIGMLGRMVPTKDFETLIRAGAVWMRTAACRDIRLVLGGDGPTRTGLERLAKREGIRDRVEFLGYLDDREVAGFFEGLDIYVHSSPGETMSTALLQAYSAGLPIIASDVPGISELVRHGRDGLLVREGDPKAIAEQVIRLSADGLERARLGRAARARAVAEWGTDRMVEEYLVLLRMLEPEVEWGHRASDLSG